MSGSGPRTRNCKRCGKECGPRRSWHPECVHLHKLAYWQGYAAAVLWKARPHVCVGCWTNIEALEAACWQFLKDAKEREGEEYLWPRGLGASKQLNTLLRENGFHGWPRSLWEADHIVPRVEGGSDLGLDNLRILCVPCHKIETKKLAARRAEQKRNAPYTGTTFQAAQGCNS